MFQPSTLTFITLLLFLVLGIKSNISATFNYVVKAKKKEETCHWVSLVFFLGFQGDTSEDSSRLTRICFFVNNCTLLLFTVRFHWINRYSSPVKGGGWAVANNRDPYLSQPNINAFHTASSRMGASCLCIMDLFVRYRVRVEGGSCCTSEPAVEVPQNKCVDIWGPDLWLYGPIRWRMAPYWWFLLVWTADRPVEHLGAMLLWQMQFFSIMMLKTCKLLQSLRQIGESLSIFTPTLPLRNVLFTLPKNLISSNVF